MSIFSRVTAIALITPLVAFVVTDDAFAQYSLAGRWLVSYDGTSVERWEIQTQNNRLSIVVFNEQVPGISLPGDYREPLSVERAIWNQSVLYLDIRRTESMFYQYQLSFVRPGRIEGVYKYVDTTLSDIGGIGGDAGTIVKAGRVVMTRML